MIVGHPVCLESLFSVGTEAAIICSITAQDTGMQAKNTCLKSCGKLKPETHPTHPELSSFDFVDCSGVYVASAKHTLTLACTHTHTQTHTWGNHTLLLTSRPIHKEKLQRQIRNSVWVPGQLPPVLGRNHWESSVIMYVKHASEVLSMVLQFII